MKVVVANDHGAVDLAKRVLKHLEERGIEFTYLGVGEEKSVDYPDKAREAVEEYRKGGYDRGILMCGTGIGISLAANKVKGIRAAACSETFSAKYTRLHNDANILCLGGRVIGAGVALEMTDLFLDTEFEGGRHQRRVDAVMDIEKY